MVIFLYNIQKVTAFSISYQIIGLFLNPFKPFRLFVIEIECIEFFQFAEQSGDVLSSNQMVNKHFS